MFVPVAVIAVFGLMASFASVAQAFPSRTAACTNCHSGVNVPVVATAGAGSATAVDYAISAPTATSVAVFDGATKVAVLAPTDAFLATVGTTYVVYAVTGPTITDGIGTTSFTAAAPVVTPTAPAVPVLSAMYNTAVNSVTIAWPAVPGATSYDYQIGSGAIVNIAGTTVTLTGLAEGNTAFKVSATNGSGSSAYAATMVAYTIPVVVPTPPPTPQPPVTPTPTPVLTGYKVRLHLNVSHKYARKLTATLTNQVTGVKLTARLDRKGNVTFAGVPIGTYKLTVSGSKRVKFRARTIVVNTPAQKHHERDGDDD
jgi:hypothetical protein